MESFKFNLTIFTNWLPIHTVHDKIIHNKYRQNWYEIKDKEENHHKIKGENTNQLKTSHLASSFHFCCDFRFQSLLQSCISLTILLILFHITTFPQYLFLSKFLSISMYSLYLSISVSSPLENKIVLYNFFLILSSPSITLSIILLNKVVRIKYKNKV